eukprot:gb/GECH01000576.1/.p1 GENE.gb/GECH01000576.1/~~gb/GECH01000576.1/.p1  ORF type:complete len:166 (+),score=49.53 gb/GECH01000576.1/:1-498(+)
MVKHQPNVSSSPLAPSTKEENNTSYRNQKKNATEKYKNGENLSSNIKKPQKLASKKKNKKSNEIENIFGDLKTQKRNKTKISKSKKDKKKNKKALNDRQTTKISNQNKTNSSLQNKGDAFRDETANNQSTKHVNGLRIYTEEELGLNNSDAGNTSDCPFDCNCCF